MTRLSAVSAVLQKVECDLEEYLAEKSAPEYTVKIANTEAEKNAAYRLGYSVYLQKGYISANAKGIHIERFDRYADTTILLVSNQEGIAVGTLTLVLNKHHQIPCHQIFQEEINSFFKPGKPMAEMTRLALAENQKNSSQILATLFHGALIYLYKFQKIETLLIEVNPSHVGFYKNLLGFQELGCVKGCGRVNDAPAQLMTVNLKEIDRNITLSQLKKIETVKGFRFLKYALEKSVCENLLMSWKKQIKRKLTIRFSKCTSVKV